MITQFLISLRALAVFTFVTCVLYPVAVTAVSQLFIPGYANGSLVYKKGKLVGSELLAQKFSDPGYFWPRPSAADYATVASGASNQGFSSAKLLATVEERKALNGRLAPADLLFASGSGLDPHVSVEAAQFQVERVAAARKLSFEQVSRLVVRFVQAPQFGFLGQPRVNVLLLNEALDRLE